MAKPKGGGTLHALFEVNERERREFADRIDRITRGERVPPLHTSPVTVAESPTATVVGESGDTVSLELSEAVASDPASTVVVESPTTEVPEPETMWQAEETGALVTPSRVRPIRQATDVLTPAERSVYVFLASQSHINNDGSRSVEAGYDRIAKTALVSKRNAALIIDRLIRKGFLAIERVAGFRSGTHYQVLSEESVLQKFALSGRHSFARIGNGIFFVRPVHLFTRPATTVAVASTSTVVDEAEGTVVDLELSSLKSI